MSVWILKSFNFYAVGGGTAGQNENKLWAVVRQLQEHLRDLTQYKIWLLNSNSFEIHYLMYLILILSKNVINKQFAIWICAKSILLI